MDTLILDFWPQECERRDSVVLRHPVRDDLLRQPWETNSVGATLEPHLGPWEARHGCWCLKPEMGWWPGENQGPQKGGGGVRAALVFCYIPVLTLMCSSDLLHLFAC